MGQLIRDLIPEKDSEIPDPFERNPEREARSVFNTVDKYETQRALISPPFEKREEDPKIITRTGRLYDLLKPDSKETEPVEFTGKTGGMDSYQAHKTAGSDIVAPYKDDSTSFFDYDKSGDVSGRDIANFVIGDELGVLGFKWDQNGFDWDTDHFIAQWSEHPIISTIATAGMVFPILGAFRKSMLVGRLGVSAAQGGRVGTAVTKALTKIGDIKLLKLEVPEPLLKSFSHTDEIRRIASAPAYMVTDEAGKMIGHRLWNMKAAQNVMGMTDDAVEKLISRSDLRKQLLGYHHQTKALALQSRMMETARGLTKTGEQMKWYDPLAMRYRMQQSFSNKYWHAVTQPTQEYFSRLDHVMTDLSQAKIFEAIPSAEHGKDLYRYLIGSLDETGLRATGISDDGVEWILRYKDEARKTLEDQFNSGFLKKETYDLFKNEFDGVHLPALKINTEGALTFDQRAMVALNKLPAKEARKLKENMDLLMASKPFNTVRGPTLRARLKNVNKALVEANLDSLITDPSQFTVGGILRDRYYHESYKFLTEVMSDFLENGTASKFKDSLMMPETFNLLPSTVKNKFWIGVHDLPDTPAKEILTRMVGKKLNNASPILPYIHKDLFDEFFGPTGMLSAGDSAVTLFELLTAVHKTSKTALNIPTHFQNIAGNMLGFHAMAGFNSFAPQALDDANITSKAFYKIAKSHIDKDIPLDKLFEYDELSRVFEGAKLKDVFGNDIEMATFFADHGIREMLETGAFESVEGFANVKNLYKRLLSAEGKENAASQTGMFAKKYFAKFIGSVGSSPVVKDVLDTGSSMYLAEDVIPKMTYALHLARKGYSNEAVVREVSRRMPMYGAVGDSIKGARKVLFPWATFYTETMRIMKNNMEDYPLRTFGFLQVPQMIQAGAAAAGIAPSQEEVWRNLKGLAPWAAKPSSVQLNADAAAPLMGGFTGAFTGATAGSVLGGAKGAAVGAVAGAVGGAALSSAFNKDDSDDVRAWALDFLPHSSLYPTSTSPYAYDKVISGNDFPQSWFDMSPQQPLAVILPLLSVITGQGQQGQDIEAEPSLLAHEKMSKMALGMMGFLSPPFIQKYGMKLEGSPLSPLNAMEQVFARNGEMTSITSKNITATVGGLLVGGAAALGGAKFRAAAGAAASTGSVAITALGAAGAGLIAAREANVRKLMTDLGVEENPVTGQSGSLLHDFVFNSFLGLPKSWKVSAMQEEMNEQQKKRHYKEQRTYLNKQYYDAVRMKNEGLTIDILERTYMTFVEEYDRNPILSTEKYTEWLKDRKRALKTFPSMSRRGEAELTLRFNTIRDEVTKTRTKYQEQLYQLYLQEIKMRRLQGLKGATLIPAMNSTIPEYKKKKRKSSIIKQY